MLPPADCKRELRDVAYPCSVKTYLPFDATGASDDEDVQKRSLTLAKLLWGSTNTVVSELVSHRGHLSTRRGHPALCVLDISLLPSLRGLCVECFL